MSLSQPPASDAFDQLCHEVSNPLMVIAGHAFLLERAILQHADLPEDERARLMTDLTRIADMVREMADTLDEFRAELDDVADEA